MKTIIETNDYDIQLVEREIIEMVRDHRCEHPDCEKLLEIRKAMINDRILEHQEEIITDIVEFNDALTEALKKMLDKALSIWDSIKDNKDWGDTVELVAKCYLRCPEYPDNPTPEDEDRIDLWEALCDDKWNLLYAMDGLSFGTLRISGDSHLDIEEIVGMNCEPLFWDDNWNEGLDRELTKDLHLTGAFHKLFRHTNFAITDFLWVRDFDIEIKIEVDKKV